MTAIEVGCDANICCKHRLVTWRKISKNEILNHDLCAVQMEFNISFYYITTIWT